MTPVVYTQPNCQPCNATKRLMDKHGISYEVVDISEDHDAREFVMSLGHQQTPVVLVGTESWSGFRHDKITALKGKVA